MRYEASLGSRERQEFDMSDWNAKTIEEFRANEGGVGGTFEGDRLSSCITAAGRAGRSTSAG